MYMKNQRSMTIATALWYVVCTQSPKWLTSTNSLTSEIGVRKCRRWEWSWEPDKGRACRVQWDNIRAHVDIYDLNSSLLLGIPAPLESYQDTKEINSFDTGIVSMNTSSREHHLVMGGRGGIMPLGGGAIPGRTVPSTNVKEKHRRSLNDTKDMINQRAWQPRQCQFQLFQTRRELSTCASTCTEEQHWTSKYERRLVLTRSTKIH